MVLINVWRQSWRSTGTTREGWDHPSLVISLSNLALIWSQHSRIVLALTISLAGGKCAFNFHLLALVDRWILLVSESKEFSAGTLAHCLRALNSESMGICAGTPAPSCVPRMLRRVALSVAHILYG